MNYNSIRALLKQSVTIANAYSRKVLIRNVVIIKKCSETHLLFARIYCTNTNNTSTDSKSSQKYESNDEFDMFEFDLPDHTNIDYDALTGNDPEKIKQLKLIQQEIELQSQKAQLVPKKLEFKHWEKLMAFETRNRRKKYLNYLWASEKRKENSLLLKEESRKRLLLLKEKQKTEPPSEKNTNSPIQYGLAHNSMFLRIYSQHINSFYNWKLLQTSVYGYDLLIDCGYEKFMNDREITLCGRQLVHMWGLNRDSFNPFNIIFCNFNRNGQVAKIMEKLIPMIFDSDFPFTHTEKNYLDLFPREKLIYLTPHCHNSMKTYEPDKVYIIGGVTDVGDCDPLSLTKAKKDGLRMAKFPLDKYINWTTGLKTLTFPKCVGILTDLKDGKDWNSAFRHIKRNTKDELTSDVEKPYVSFKLKHLKKEYEISWSRKKDQYS